MDIKKATNGTVICQAGQPLTDFLVIASGNVRAVFSAGEIKLGKGDILGIQDILGGIHSCTYIADSEISLIIYPFQNKKVFLEFLNKNQDVTHLFFTASLRFTYLLAKYYVQFAGACNGTYKCFLQDYEEYRTLCAKYQVSPKSLPALDTLEPFVAENSIEPWLSVYYEELKELGKEAKTALYGKPGLLKGFLFKSSQDVSRIFLSCVELTDYLSDIAPLLLNENHLDFLDLYTNLLFKVMAQNADTTALHTKITAILEQARTLSVIDPALYDARLNEYRDSLDHWITAAPAEDSSTHPSELIDSLNAILNFGGCDDELSARFTQNISLFKEMLDKNDTGDAARKLRLALSNDFYMIYEKVFLASLKTKDSFPTPVSLFLNFGFVDEELAGWENVKYLLTLTSTFKGAPNYGVYTFYEWLVAIYEGEKEPSRNEFDLDYQAFIHEQKVTNKISAAEEQKLSQNTMSKVMFELRNAFPLVNKITFGRVSTFCPLFSDHNVLKNLSEALVTPEKVIQSLGQLKAVDFSVFYRETVYSNEGIGVPREFIQVEVLPDVILMPNIGTRGAMWQEIEGKVRTTPARMMVSVFSLEDISQVLIHLAGEFRWEMCKRIQGAHWNDLSERSLTSEYTDYIQFYRKNHELSTDAKEKIKTALLKAKNSYKEMFIRDYMTWINFEGKGAPHLNKTARGILFTYCPFALSIRDKLKLHPLYQEIINHYNLKTAQKLHHHELICSKITKSGASVPDIINRQQEFIQY